MDKFLMKIYLNCMCYFWQWFEHVCFTLLKYGWLFIIFTVFFFLPQLKTLVLWLPLALCLLFLEKTPSYLFISHLKPVLCPWKSDGLEKPSSFISLRTDRRKSMAIRTEWVCPSISWRKEIFHWLWETFNHQIWEIIHAKSSMKDVCRQEKFIWEREVRYYDVLSLVCFHQYSFGMFYVCYGIFINNRIALVTWTCNFTKFLNFYGDTYCTCLNFIFWRKKHHL